MLMNESEHKVAVDAAMERAEELFQELYQNSAQDAMITMAYASALLIKACEDQGEAFQEYIKLLGKCVSLAMDAKVEVDIQKVEAGSH
jgi:hypothetical protein